MPVAKPINACHVPRFATVLDAMLISAKKEKIIAAIPEKPLRRSIAASSIPKKPKKYPTNPNMRSKIPTNPIHMEIRADSL